MKDATKKIIESDVVNTTPEKVSNFDIAVNEFDPTTAYIELEEDIDKKVISYIEREVRQSYEYRKYINYLKKELDLTKCSLLPGVDIKTDPVSLEFHHYPMTLYEITEVIARQRVMTLMENEKVSCFDISEQIVEEHFRGNVGLVPLTKTIHEMAHNRSIIIPITKVEGNYKNFVKKYSSYIPEDIKERISEAEISSISEDAKEFNAAKLEKNKIQLNVRYLPREEI